MNKTNHNSPLRAYRVGPFHFCVNAIEAEAMIEMPVIRSVPMMPKSVAGVFSYRNMVGVAVSLRSKFGLTDSKSKLFGPLVLTRIDDELKGFQVDEVLEIMENKGLTCQSLPTLDKNKIFDYTIIIDNNIYFHTDFEKLFSAEDSEELVPFLTSIAGDSHENGSPFRELSQYKSANLRPPISVAAEETAIDNSDLSNRQEERPKGVTDAKEESTPNENSLSISADAKLSAIHSKRHVDPLYDDYLTIQVKEKNKSNLGPSIGNTKSIRKPYVYQIPQWAQGDRPKSTVKKGYSWKRITAVVLLLIILGLSGVWLWPNDRHWKQNRAPVSVVRIETQNNQVDRTTLANERTRQIRQKKVTKTVKESISQKRTKISAISQLKVTESQTTKEVSDSAIPLTSTDSESKIDEQEIKDQYSNTTQLKNTEVLRIETEEFTLMIERADVPSPSKEIQNKVATGISEELIHVVVKDDTLWDIANKYLGNPYRYPELTQNSRIKDPDWIYPGDVVRIIRNKTSKKEATQN